MAIVIAAEEREITRSMLVMDVRATTIAATASKSATTAGQTISLRARNRFRMLFTLSGGVRR
jgi:hypothetical protein